MSDHTNWVTAKDQRLIANVLDALTVLRQQSDITMAVYDADGEDVPIRLWDSNGECVGGIDFRTDTSSDPKEAGQYVFETTGIDP